MASFRRFPGSWRRLGDVSAERTREAFAGILEAASAITRSISDGDPVGFRWQDDGSMLVADGPAGIALRPADLVALALDPDGHVTGRMALSGRSAEEVAEWLATHHSSAPGRESAPGRASAPERGSAPGWGSAAQIAAPDRAALCEAARWLNNADDVLTHLGLVGRLDVAGQRFVAAVPGLEIAAGLEIEAGLAIGASERPIPAFFVSGSPERRLVPGEIVAGPAADQTRRVLEFLTRLTGISE